MPAPRLLLAFCALALAGLPGPARATELVVSLAPGATRGDATQLAATAGGRVVDAIPELGAYLVAVPGRAVALRGSALVRSVERNGRLGLAGVVDDPFLALQWSLGQIGAAEAWAGGTGDPTVVIAVIDTGIDYVHPDLAGKVILGPDFANGDVDPIDPHGHGTAVAGIAAARAGNGLGIAGVCPGCTLMAIKVVRDGSTEATKFDTAQGIVWAADHGADVINLSLSGPTDSPLQREAVAYAAARGVVLVAAAGNDGDAKLQYPAAYEEVVAVAASTDRDRLAPFSTRGGWIDLAAPGTKLLATAAGAYARVSGTSFSAPVVGGAAGLLLSRLPALGPDAIRAALVTGTRPLADEEVRRLDLAYALRRALDPGAPLEPDPPLTLTIARFAISPGSWFVAGFDPPEPGRVFAAAARVVRDDTGEIVESGRISCRARIGARHLRVVRAAFARGVALCTWRVPAGAAGKRVSGTVEPSFREARAVRAFTTRVARGSQGAAPRP
ncbi:MAG: S8 family serine peptidase [Thermoleophilia bacterium]|nr:S8 family serine peptidase [Thermoleophilia bacterium]